jgi:hypothetical protein
MAGFQHAPGIAGFGNFHAAELDANDFFHALQGGRPRVGPNVFHGRSWPAASAAAILLRQGRGLGRVALPGAA